MLVVVVLVVAGLGSGAGGGVGPANTLPINNVPTKINPRYTFVFVI